MKLTKTKKIVLAAVLGIVLSVGSVVEAKSGGAIEGIVFDVLVRLGLIDSGGSPIGAPDAAAIHDDTAGEIAAVALKGTPVSGDILLIEDSADSNNKKRITIGTLPSGAAETLSQTLAAGNTADAAVEITTGGSIISSAGSGTSAGQQLLVQAGNGGATSGLGGDVVLDGGNGGSGNARGGHVDLNGGNGTGNQPGGQVQITGGTAGGTGTGGAIDIDGGQGIGAGGGNVVIDGGDCFGGGGAGGNAQLHGGSGDTTGAGGRTWVQGGAGGASGNGGDLWLYAGVPGGTAGNGGDVDVNAGVGTAGTGGDITLDAGNSFGATAANEGGDITLTTGNGGASATSGGGDFVVSTGSGGATSGPGGDITLGAGPGLAGGARGGNITITSGDGSPCGDVTIQGANAGGGGFGGDVLINSGNSGGTQAGNVTITTGTATPLDGNFTVNTNSTNQFTITGTTGATVINHTLDVGTVTLATDQGDFAAGSATRSMFYDESAGDLNIETGTVDIDWDTNAAEIAVFADNANTGASAAVEIRTSGDVATLQMITHSSGYVIPNQSNLLATSGSLELGTATSGNDLVLTSGGTPRFDLNGTNGHLLARTDNSYDIGAAGATRPRSVYIGTALRVGSTTSGSNAGDIAAGSSSAQAMVWNNSSATFEIRDTGAEVDFQVDSGLVTTLKRDVENHTADNTLTEAEAFKVNTNLGDAGTQTQTLPSSVDAGTSFTFFVAVAFELRVDPAAGDKIVDSGLSGLADGEYIVSSTVGDSITLVALSDGDWAVIAKNGTGWAEETP